MNLSKILALVILIAIIATGALKGTEIHAGLGIFSAVLSLGTFVSLYRTKK